LTNRKVQNLFKRCIIFPLYDTSLDLLEEKEEKEEKCNKNNKKIQTNHSITVMLPFVDSN
jgi:hypothetical protein